jgi:hypothetical protein
VFNLEPFPLIALIDPGKETGDTSYTRLANRISARGRGRKVQQLHLNIGCQVGQAHQLANTLPAQTSEPRDIGKILCLALPNHVIKMYGESQHLSHAREMSRPGWLLPV